MVTNASEFRLYFRAQVLYVFQSFGYLKVFKKSVFGKYLIVSVEYFCKTVSFCAQYSPILQFLSWWLEIPPSPAVNINKSHSKLTQLTSLKIIQRPDRSDKGNMENWHIFLVYTHSQYCIYHFWSKTLMLFIEPVGVQQSSMKKTIIDHVPPLLQRKGDFLENNILEEKLFRSGMAGMEMFLQN